MQMDIAITAKQFLKPWYFYHFCPCQQSCPSLSGENIEEETKGQIWMISDGNVFVKEDTKSKKCGNVSGGETSI